ncbi:hypothetical protein ONZ51_g10976 [Trametes cubensis]|uniref:Heterokaryon incompatibility domain-containing protein n=1 Tax=Trametes cubensis TaxID=1111947 RepID=A0AAD7X668_9APHY|nr:hypothetical protein ONZ51_g10976 [Trametes cubensis]
MIQSHISPERSLRPKSGHALDVSSECVFLQAQHVKVCSSAAFHEAQVRCRGVCTGSNFHRSYARLGCDCLMLIATILSCQAMELSPRPPSICASAWEGVFAAHFGLTGDPIGREWHSRWGFNRLPQDQWTGGYAYTVSSSALLKCAQSNCLWCRLLVKDCVNVDRIRRRSFLWPFDKIDVQVGTNVGSDRPLGMFVRVSDKYGDPQWFSMYTAQDDPAARWIDRRTRIPRVGAPHVLAWAKTCVEQCVHSHPRCQEIAPHANGSAFLPTRLIDCSNSLCLRIVETDASTPSEPYVAISYVWGGDQPHRTTKDNLARYMIRLDDTKLPQTIRDAVRVTQALGVRFLWMDSLCIVQDSQEDMHRELTRMRDVYRYAYVTIDAASAASVNEGFLKDRRPLNADAMLPFICPRDPAETSTSKTPQIGMVYLVNDDDSAADRKDVLTHGDGHDSGYTGGRAWCLQEALLSTRSLVFTSETLQLRCYTETRNVGGAKHDDERSLPRLPEATLRHYDANVQVAQDSDEWKDIYTRWWTIVRDYSRRSLTNPSDKLTAFAGLAQMFAPMLGPDYLAGLWRGSLLNDLLWWRDSPNTSTPPLERPKEISGAVVVMGVHRRATGARRPYRSPLSGSGRMYSQAPKRYPPFRIDCDDDLTLREMWFVPLCHQSAVHGLVVTRAEQGTSARPEGSKEVYRRVAYGRLSDGHPVPQMLDATAPFPTVEIELV